MGDESPKSSGSDSVEIEDGPETWIFDRAFFGSGWECIWNSGCIGIEAYDASAARTGCCSVGVELVDEEEAMLISALAACISPARFAHAQEAQQGSVFSDETNRFTRVVGPACIFFNPVDASAPTGCALHLEAQAQGEPPSDWKPVVCSQVPIRVDTAVVGGRTSHRVRAWTREDWGEDGVDMLWWCTEANAEAGRIDAFVAETPVALRLRAEIASIAGTTVADQLITQISRG